MLDTYSDFLTEALDGLSQHQKRLHPKWFYDHRGSELFEQITRLPEYYPTRVETAILRAHAAPLAALVPPGGALVELGAGASLKTRLLLDEGAHLGAYAPVDISESYLNETAETLRGLYPLLDIVPVVGDFLSAVALPGPLAESEKVGFFPGSTIGNLSQAEAVALLTRARAWPNMHAFVLGADLVKDISVLIAAYDDAAGVTAAFNRNILRRMHRELGAQIELDAFRHEARWNATDACIEMHLVATRPTQIELAGAVIAFEPGETIHTESCRKYTRDSIAVLAGQAGWTVSDLLTDDDAQFAVAVLT